MPFSQAKQGYYFWTTVSYQRWRHNQCRVSDTISVACSLFPDRLVSVGDICAAVSLPLSVLVHFWHVSLGMGGSSMNFSPQLAGLVVIGVAQAVVGMLLSQDR